MDRRRFIEAAALGGLAAGTTGCLGSGQSDQATGNDGSQDGDGGGGDPLTFTFFEVLPDDPVDPEQADEPLTTQEILSWYVQQYNESSDYEVSFQHLGVGQWYSQASTMVKGDGSPDIMTSLAGMPMAPMVNTDDLLPLQDIVDDEVIENRNVNPLRFENGNVLRQGEGDDVYGIPFYAGSLPLWYNKVVLEDAGVDPSRLEHASDVSWEEFNTICGQVRDAGYIPLSFGNRTGRNIPYIIGAAMLKTVGIEAIYELKDQDSDRSLTDDAFVDALELVTEWVDEGYINDDNLAIGVDDARAYFFNNEAAFISSGMWITYSYQAMADPEVLGPLGEDWDYMWWPCRPDVYPDGQHELMGFEAGTMTVPAKAEERGNLDAVSEFLNGYLGEETTRVRANHEDREIVWDGMEMSSHPVTSALHADITSEENALAPRPDIVLVPEFKSAVTAEGQKLLGGEQGPEATLEKIQTQMDEGIARYR